MAVFKYNLPVNFDGFSTTRTVDVSQFMPDARLAIWTVYDPSATEVVGAVSILDAATVQLFISPAPAEGNYQLVGLA